MQVDLKHALSRVVFNNKSKHSNYEVECLKPDKATMVKARARIQNMALSEEAWNDEVRELLPRTCVNFLVHRKPVSFNDSGDYVVHRQKCVGPVASTSRPPPQR